MSTILGQATQEVKPKISLLSNFEEFEQYVTDTLTVIVDKFNKADKQNIILEVQNEGSVELCGVSFLKGRIKTNMNVWDDASQNVLVGETYTQGFQRLALSVKMVTDIMSRFRGLRKTVATLIKLDFYERQCVMTIYERGADYTEEDMQNGVEDEYGQASSFTVPLININPTVERELDSLAFVETTEEYNSLNLRIYLELMYPQIVEEMSEATDAIVFTEDNIYVRTSSHILSIRNSLVKNDIIPCMRNLKLNKVVANFLMTVLNKHETFYIHMEEKPNHAILMTVQVEGMVVARIIPQVPNPINLADYSVELGNRFEVSKIFLEDALRRVTVGNEPALMEFVASEGVPQLVLSNASSSEKYTTKVPVLGYEGNNQNFAFRLQPKFLNLMAVTYLASEMFASQFPENVTLALDLTQPTNGRGEPTITFGVSDAKGIWNSIKINLKNEK